MAVEVATLVAKLQADLSGFAKPLQDAINHLKEFKKEAQEAGEGVTDSLDKAWATLRSKSDAQIAAQKKQIQDAAQTIKSAATSTSGDIERAMNLSKSLVAGLSADGTKLGSILEAVAGGFELIKRGAEAAEVNLGLLGRVVSVATTVMTGAMGVATGLALALGTVALAGKHMAESLAEDVIAARQLVNVSGLTFEAANNLRGAVGLMGQEAGSLTTAFFRLGFEIESGGESIGRFGIDLRDALGNAKSEGQILLELRDMLSQVGDASVRNAALLDLFGRAGRSMIVLFSQSREAMEKYLATADKYDQLTKEEVAIGLDFIRSQNELSLAWQGLSSVLGAKTAPAIAATNRALAEMLGFLRQLIAEPEAIEKRIDVHFNILGVDVSTMGALEGLRESLVGALTGMFPTIVIPVRLAVSDEETKKQAAEILKQGAGTVFPPLGAGMAIRGFMQAPQAEADAAQRAIAAATAAAGDAGAIIAKNIGPKNLEAAQQAWKDWAQTVTQQTDLAMAKTQAFVEMRQMTELAATRLAKEQIEQRTQDLTLGLQKQIDVLRTNVVTGETRPMESLDPATMKKVTALLQEQAKIRADADKQLLGEDAKASKARQALLEDDLRVLRDNISLQTQTRQQAIDQQAQARETAARGLQEDALSLAINLRKIQEDQAQETLNNQLKSIQDQRTALQMEYAKRPADLAKLNADLALLDNKADTARLAAKKQVADAENAFMIALQAEAQRAAEAETAHWKVEADKQLAIFDNLASQRITVEQETERRIAEMMTAPDLDPGKRAELATQLYIAQSNIRIIQSQSERSKILDQLQKELDAEVQAYAAHFKTIESLTMDSAVKRSQVRVKAFQDSLRTEKQLQLDEFAAMLKASVDAIEAQMNTREQIVKDATIRLINVQVDQFTKAQTTLADVATQGALSMVNAQTQVLQQRNAFLLDAQQSILAWRLATAEATGQVGKSIALMFTETLTKGRDFWSNMQQLATDSIQATQGTLSDLFFDWMSGKFDTLQQIATSFWDSLKRSIANFLSSSLLNELGQFFANLLGSGTGQSGSIISNLASQLLGSASGSVQQAAQAQNAIAKLAQQLQTQLGPAVVAASVALTDQFIPAVQKAAVVLGLIGGGGGAGAPAAGDEFGPFTSAISRTTGGIGDEFGTFGAIAASLSSSAGSLQTVTGIMSNVSRLPTSLFNPGFWSSLGSILNALKGGWAVFSTFLSDGAGFFTALKEGFSTAIGGITGAAGGSIGAFSAVLSAAAIAVNLFTAAMNLASENTQTFASGAAAIAGTIGGGIAGAAIGSAFGGVGAIPGWLIGSLIGGAAGGSAGGLMGKIGLFGTPEETKGDALERVITGRLNLAVIGINKTFSDILMGPAGLTHLLADTIGNAIGGIGGKIVAGFINPIGGILNAIFGSNSQYIPKRMAAAQTAIGAATQLGGVYTTAARSGDLAQVLSALQRNPTGDARNPVRTMGALPPDIAAQLGISGPMVGGNVQFDWSQLSQQMFQGLMNQYRTHPELVGLISGSADVPYLPGEQAQKLADDIRNAAINMIEAFKAFEDLRDTIDKQAADVKKAVDHAFPPDLAAKFNTQVLEPIHKQMQDIANSAPVDQIASQLSALDQRLQQRLANWARFAQTYAASLAAIPLMPGGASFQRQIHYGQFQPYVPPAADAPTTGPDPATLTGFAKKYYDALQPEFQKLLDLLDSGTQQQIEDQQKLYDSMVAGWTKLANAVVTVRSEIATLTHNVPMQAQAIKEQIAGLDQSVAAAQDAYSKAVQGGDVTEVAEAEKALHDAIMNRYQTEMELNAQIQQQVTNTRQAFEQGLQAAIQKAMQWKNAIDQINVFISGLQQSGLGPGNPMDQLTSARASFQSALSAFQTHPTAEGLTGLQGPAQALLQLAEQVYSRPSTQYQQLFQQVMAALQGAQGTAAGQVSIPAQQLEVMQAQLTALQDLDSADGAISAAVLNLQTATQSGNQAQITAAQNQLNALVAARNQLESAISSGNLTDLQNADRAWNTANQWGQGTLNALQNQFLEAVALRNQVAILTNGQVGAATSAAQIGAQTVNLLAQILSGVDAFTGDRSQTTLITNAIDASNALLTGILGATGYVAGVFHSAGFTPSGYTAPDGTWVPTNRTIYWPPGAAMGMEFVPMNNMPRMLHYGERVLTAEENRAFDAGSRASDWGWNDDGGGPSVDMGGVTVNVALSGDPGKTDMKAWARKTVDALAEEINDRIRRGDFGASVVKRVRHTPS